MKIKVIKAGSNPGNTPQSNAVNVSTRNGGQLPTRESDIAAIRSIWLAEVDAARATRVQADRNIFFN